MLKCQTDTTVYYESPPLEFEQSSQNRVRPIQYSNFQIGGSVSEPVLILMMMTSENINLEAS